LQRDLKSVFILTGTKKILHIKSRGCDNFHSCIFDKLQNNWVYTLISNKNPSKFFSSDFFCIFFFCIKYLATNLHKANKDSFSSGYANVRAYVLAFVHSGNILVLAVVRESRE